MKEEAAQERGRCTPGGGSSTWRALCCSPNVSWNDLVYDHPLVIIQKKLKFTSGASRGTESAAALTPRNVFMAWFMETKLKSCSYGLRGRITARQFGKHVGGSKLTNLMSCRWTIQQNDWKNIKSPSSYAQTDIWLHLLGRDWLSVRSGRRPLFGVATISPGY